VTPLASIAGIPYVDGGKFTVDDFHNSPLCFSSVLLNRELSNELHWGDFFCEASNGLD
jgi:hypothetical protein